MNTMGFVRTMLLTASMTIVIWLVFMALLYLTGGWQ